MDEIINAFGIDARLIIVQLVNFGILMIALGYFLYKPILRLLKEREDKISQGLNDAEAAAKARAEATEEKQTILTSAHMEAGEVAKRAKAAADLQAAELKTAAEEKAQAILADAEIKREQIKAAALKESEKEIASLAVLAAEKVLQGKA
jgi:F-type H+-transporting ATPase subunit b